MENKFYTIDKITKKVSKEEFYNFIKNYPRKLEKDVWGISEPPSISYNDFQLANRWSYSVIAYTWAYDDDPKGFWYIPEDERSYVITTNYEDLFNSKTEHEE